MRAGKLIPGSDHVGGEGMAEAMWISLGDAGGLAVIAEQSTQSFGVIRRPRACPSAKQTKESRSEWAVPKRG